jgi:selenocysteine-specific elongation factor
VTPTRESPASTAPRHFILGTAGHVDHGKTELVRALTGHDTDRLKEEKERGISIELGFAPLSLGEDVFIGVIDVPGHERFVRQMVAGAGGIDLAMLLVAADEGVMPQTVEHMEVLRSLGVRRGLVVISKLDLVADASGGGAASAETMGLLRDEIATLVRGTFLEGAPVVPVSARTGYGLDALREALLALARSVETRTASGPFRLAIDRVFHQKGIGVVVTGSCYSGRVAAGDELDLLPLGRRVRVREIQSFGAKRAAGAAGERLALALHGAKLDEIERGDMLTTPGRFAATRTVDVRLTLAAHGEIEMENRERLRVHHGAREVLGRVILLEGDALRAGESALAQLRLESPIVADAGDSFVIRTYSPARVIGGGAVIDPRADAHRRSDAAAIERLRVREHGDPQAVLAKTIERAGADGVENAQVDAAAVASLAASGTVVGISGRWFHRRALESLAARAVELAADHTRRNPLHWGVDKEELRQRLGFGHGAAIFNRVIEVLATMQPLFLRENRVRAGTPDLELPAPLEAAIQALRGRIRAAGVAFLARDEAARAWPGAERFADAVQVLLDRGDAVDLGDGLIDPDALGRCERAIAELLARQEELSVGDLKEALGITRKHAIPLLEYLDGREITARRGNVRVAGRRLKNRK